MYIMKNVWYFFVRNNKLEVEDAELNTPLLLAAVEGSTEVMSVLIQEGAKLTRTDGKGNNIVHLMVGSDNADVLKVSKELCVRMNTVYCKTFIFFI